MNPDIPVPPWVGETIDWLVAWFLPLAETMRERAATFLGVSIGAMVLISIAVTLIRRASFPFKIVGAVMLLLLIPGGIALIQAFIMAG